MALRGSGLAFGHVDVSASCVAAAHLHALAVQDRFSSRAPPTSCRTRTALVCGRTSSRLLPGRDWTTTPGRIRIT
eukprot:5016846-Pyramimonas_sp.AAC.1